MKGHALTKTSWEQIKFGARSTQKVFKNIFNQTTWVGRAGGFHTAPEDRNMGLFPSGQILSPAAWKPDSGSDLLHLLYRETHSLRSMLHCFPSFQPSATPR